MSARSVYRTQMATHPTGRPRVASATCRARASRARRRFRRLAWRLAVAAQDTIPACAAKFTLDTPTPRPDAGPLHPRSARASRLRCAAWSAARRSTQPACQRIARRPPVHPARHRNRTAPASPAPPRPRHTAVAPRREVPGAPHARSLSPPTGSGLTLTPLITHLSVNAVRRSVSPCRQCRRLGEICYDAFHAFVLQHGAGRARHAHVPNRWRTVAAGYLNCTR